MLRHLFSRPLALLVVVGAAATPSAVAATGPQARPQASRATFFIAEAYVGYGMGAAFAEDPDGLAMRLTLGVGGRPRGWPTRFYLIGNVDYARYAGTVKGALSADTERATTSWSFGLRTLVPIVRHLRFYTDVALGQTLVSSGATIGRGIERYTAEDDAFLMELGLGLQYRFSLHFSVGAKVNLAFPLNLDDFDVIAAVAGARGDSGPVNPAFLLSGTLHL